MDNYEVQFGLLRSRAFFETDNCDLFRRLLLWMELHGDYQAHIALYREILDAQPYAALAWYNLGIAYQQSDNLDEALEALEYAFICNPGFDAAYYAFAELAIQDGQFRRALQSLEEMQQHTDVDELLLVRLSECALLCGHVQEATRYAQQALRLHPFCADACYWLGRSAAATAEHRVALKWFREAVRLDNDREDLQRALGEAYLQHGKPKEARVHFLRAVDLAPDEAANWAGAAVALLHTGTPDMALELLEQAAEYTDSSELQYCRATCLFLLARRQEAWPVFHLALQENFNFHPAIFRWAPALALDTEVQLTIANFH
jgi:tetratricopeptide (TPR) repeat protein